MIKSFLIRYLIRYLEQETSVIKKANDFVSIKFGDVRHNKVSGWINNPRRLSQSL